MAVPAARILEQRSHLVPGTDVLTTRLCVCAVES